MKFLAQTDSFSTKAAYKIFKEKTEQQTDLLFLTGTDTLYEGSFEVRALSNANDETSEITGQKLLERCNQLMGKKKFSLLSRPATAQPGGIAETVYVIKTNRRQYDLFTNEKDFTKSDWTPSIFRVTSYWRK